MPLRFYILLYLKLASLRWGAGMVIWLERGADLHMAQRIPLPLTVSCFSKADRLVLPFWCRLTRVVPDRGPLNGCVFLADISIAIVKVDEKRCKGLIYNTACSYTAN